MIATRRERDATTRGPTHDAATHDTATSEKRSRRSLAMAMAVPSVAATIFTTRASTRMRMRAGDDEAGARSQWRRRRRGAVQRNDGGGVVPETPHARRGARVPRVRSTQTDRVCARSTTRRARYDGGDKGRDGGREMPDGRRSCARGACPSGFVPPPLRAVLVWLRAAGLRTRLDARPPLPPIAL